MADVKTESPAPRGEKLEAQIKSADMVHTHSPPESTLRKILTGCRRTICSRRLSKLVRWLDLRLVCFVRVLTRGIAQEAMAKFTIEKDIAQHIKRTV